MRTVTTSKNCSLALKCTRIRLLCTGLAEHCYKHGFAPTKCYVSVLNYSKLYRTVGIPLQTVQAKHFDKKSSLNLSERKLYCILFFRETNSTSGVLSSTARALYYNVPVLLSVSTFAVAPTFNFNDMSAFSETPSTSDSLCYQIHRLCHLQDL